MHIVAHISRMCKRHFATQSNNHGSLDISWMQGGSGKRGLFLAGKDLVVWKVEGLFFKASQHWVKLMGYIMNIIHLLCFILNKLFKTGFLLSFEYSTSIPTAILPYLKRIKDKLCWMFKKHNIKTNHTVKQSNLYTQLKIKYEYTVHKGDTYIFQFCLH